MIILWLILLEEIGQRMAHMANYGTNQKGNRTLLDKNNYSYNLEKKVNGTEFWRCSKFKKYIYKSCVFLNSFYPFLYLFSTFCPFYLLSILPFVVLFFVVLPFVILPFVYVPVAVLEQCINGSWLPLAFFSRKFLTAKKNYSAFDRELLAVHSLICHFRYFSFAYPCQALWAFKPYHLIP